MAGEGFVAELRKAALHAQRDARAVKENRGLETLAQEPGRLKQVHQTDRTFEGDGVEGDQRLLARLRLHVLKDLFLVVD